MTYSVLKVPLNPNQPTILTEGVSVYVVKMRSSEWTLLLVLGVAFVHPRMFTHHRHGIGG